MKSGIMAIFIMISFLLIAGHSNGRLIMMNSLTILPSNPLPLDPNINSIGLHNPAVHVEKDAMECDEERSTSEKSATNGNKVLFGLRSSFQKTKKRESSASNRAKVVFKLQPKGAVSASGPSPIVDSIVTEQRLSTSSHSPRESHMQMIRSKFQTVNVDVPKSRQSNGDYHMQQEKSNKRKLGSTPSPGGGH